MVRPVCASQPRPKKDTMKHYKSYNSRTGMDIEYSEYKTGFLPLEFSPLYCSSSLALLLYFPALSFHPVTGC